MYKLRRNSSTFVTEKVTFWHIKIFEPGSWNQSDLTVLKNKTKTFSILLVTEKVREMHKYFLQLH